MEDDPVLGYIILRLIRVGYQRKSCADTIKRMLLREELLTAIMAYLSQTSRPNQSLNLQHWFETPFLPDAIHGFGKMFSCRGVSLDRTHYLASYADIALSLRDHFGPEVMTPWRMYEMMACVGVVTTPYKLAQVAGKWKRKGVLPDIHVLEDFFLQANYKYGSATSGPCPRTQVKQNTGIKREQLQGCSLALHLAVGVANSVDPTALSTKELDGVHKKICSMIEKALPGVGEFSSQVVVAVCVLTGLIHHAEFLLCGRLSLSDPKSLAKFQARYPSSVGTTVEQRDDAVRDIAVAHFHNHRGLVENALCEISRGMTVSDTYLRGQSMFHLAPSPSCPARLSVVRMRPGKDVAPSFVHRIPYTESTVSQSCPVVAPVVLPQLSKADKAIAKKFKKPHKFDITGFPDSVRARLFYSHYLMEEQDYMRAIQLAETALNGLPGNLPRQRFEQRCRKVLNDCGFKQYSEVKRHFGFDRHTTPPVMECVTQLSSRPPTFRGVQTRGVADSDDAKSTVLETRVVPTFDDLIAEGMSSLTLSVESEQRKKRPLVADEVSPGLPFDDLPPLMYPTSTSPPLKRRTGYDRATRGGQGLTKFITTGACIRLSSCDAPPLCRWSIETKAAKPCVLNEKISSLHVPVWTTSPVFLATRALFGQKSPAKVHCTSLRASIHTDFIQVGITREKLYKKQLVDLAVDDGEPPISFAYKPDIVPAHTVPIELEGGGGFRFSSAKEAEGALLLSLFLFGGSSLTSDLHENRLKLLNQCVERRGRDIVAISFRPNALAPVLMVERDLSLLKFTISVSSHL